MDPRSLSRDLYELPIEITCLLACCGLCVACCGLRVASCVLQIAVLSGVGVQKTVNFNLRGRALRRLRLHRILRKPGHLAKKLHPRRWHDASCIVLSLALTDACIKGTQRCLRTCCAGRWSTRATCSAIALLSTTSGSRYDVYTRAQDNNQRTLCLVLISSAIVSVCSHESKM